MHVFMTIDLGPKWYGMKGKIDGTTVCMATPRVEHDAEARRIVQGLIRRQGGDCSTCRRCLIGRDG